MLYKTKLYVAICMNQLLVKYISTHLMAADASSKRINGLLNCSKYFLHKGSTSLPVTSLKPWKFLLREVSN